MEPAAVAEVSKSSCLSKSLQDAPMETPMLADELFVQRAHAQSIPVLVESADYRKHILVQKPYD